MRSYINKGGLFTFTIKSTLEFYCKPTTYLL
uniref:Uncharacterized protein n=1 Tax=Anguilla anguilla TaxID=7936 RepID=A0A0E9XXJ4_ANGAN